MSYGFPIINFCNPGVRYETPWILRLCVCSLSYPSCKAHAQYYIIICDLYGLLHHIFSDYVRNGTIFGRKVMGHKMCVLILSTTFVWNTFLILRIIRRDVIINAYIYLLVKHPLFLSEFDETWILSTNFEKCPNIKFDENLIVRAESFHADGKTDIHKAANRRFSQFLRTRLKI